MKLSKSMQEVLRSRWIGRKLGVTTSRRSSLPGTWFFALRKGEYMEAYTRRNAPRQHLRRLSRSWEDWKSSIAMESVQRGDEQKQRRGCG